MIFQGEVWWANFPDPIASEPGFRRPVVIVQADRLNRSLLGTVICVPLTGNLRWAEAPGNALLPSKVTGLPKDSVALVAQISTIAKASLDERVGRLSDRVLEGVLNGIDIALGKGLS